MNKNFTITDPLMVSNPISISIPNNIKDICGGRTCQMNLLSMKDPPIAIARNKVRLVGSSMSIGFETSETINQETNSVSQVKVTNLEKPITIKMTLNLGATNGSANKRCVYFDKKINAMSDQGVLTTFNQRTGAIQCDTYHLTDFSIEEYDPTEQI